MTTQILHKINYDFKSSFYVMEIGEIIFLKFLDLLTQQPWLTFLWTSFVSVFFIFSLDRAYMVKMHSLILKKNNSPVYENNICALKMQIIFHFSYKNLIFLY